MHTSGLVISFVDDLAAVPARRRLVGGPFTLGETRGGRQSAVLETTDPKAAHNWHEWAEAVPGVAGVEVVFVHWDEAEQEGNHVGV